MKKWMWIVGGLFTVALITGYMYRDFLMLTAFQVYVKPATAFAETIAPEAPDYKNPDHWAALPDREDAADFTPDGVSDGQANADVDVFFVHPTTYLSSADWNAPMGDKPSDNWVDNAVMPGVADARCENGMLHVNEIRTDVYDELPNMGEGNHHLLDYALFWSNIRENVSARVDAFSRKIVPE